MFATATLAKKNPNRILCLSSKKYERLCKLPAEGLMALFKGI